ncbi:MAG: InlB B-repeat-containing protein [Lachnospiraceae bacterium]|nr:InlB B-repeat-containing protein [Lachnospiraceae bacterium]
MKNVIVKASSKAPVLFAALFFFALFSFAKPVEVKAETKTFHGNVSNSQFRDGDEIWIDGDTTININSNVTINSLTTTGGPWTITIKGNAENTLTCVGSIGLGYDSLIMESGNIRIDRGIFRNITINGGTIEASVNDTYNALYANNLIIIRGGNVKASSIGNDGSCGIVAENDITISGGEIEAIGKTDGIYSYGNVSISGGNTIVKAKTTSDNTNYYSIEAHGRVTIEDPLMVTDPAGGGVSSDGKYIATTAGGTERATQAEIRRPKHSITVANDGHGTGTADPNNAPGDATIRLSATPENGYVFDEWTSEDGVTFADSKIADTTFRMLDRNVTVKANFKQEIPTEQKCTITFDKNGGSGSLSPQEVNKGIATKLKKNTFTRDHYDFRNWNTKSDGSGTSYADEGDITADTDLTLYAQWKESGGRGEKIEGGREKDHTPPSWVLNPNEKQALGITYTGLAPGTTAGYQEQGEAAKALLAAAVPKGWTKAFSFNLLNGGVPDQTLKLGTLTMFIHPEWQKAGRQYAMLSLDRYGNVAFLPDIDTDPIRCTVNLNFEGYALDVLYKDP